MPNIADGLGFVIRLVALLLAWLGIAAFVSPELAALMGLALLAGWIMLILPWIGLKSVAYRREMETALARLPAPSTYGTQPSEGSSQGGGLVVRGEDSAHLPDLVRDLPQYPGFETPLPVPPRLLFIRTLIMPMAGLIMIWGAFNYMALQVWTERQGIVPPPRIEWAQLQVLPDHRDKMEEMKRAARLIISRENSCMSITGGQMVATGESYEYAFSCLYDPIGNGSKYIAYKVWLAPSDLTPLAFGVVKRLLDDPLDEKIAFNRCMATAQAQLSASNIVVETASSRLTFSAVGRPPYNSYTRLVGTLSLRQADGQKGTTAMSCWVTSDGSAQVRLGQ